jgi:formylglycine-generating enzyme required for sulfatase activity
MLTQQYIQLTKYLAPIAALQNKDILRSCNKYIANNLLNILCDDTRPKREIYSATLAAMAPTCVMVPVQGGTLSLHSDLGKYGDDWQSRYASKRNIKHKVEDFQIGKYPVTLREWKGCRDWALENGFDMATGSSGLSGESTSDFAVTHVSWGDCLSWCNAKSIMEGLEPVYWLGDHSGYCKRIGDVSKNFLREVTMISSANGYRLPLEAEWALAANKDLTKAYRHTSANGWDCFAWEWCWEVADFIPRRRGSEQKTVYGDRTTGLCYAGLKTIAGRDGLGPNHRDYEMGFRVARNL